jgi:nitrilase
VDPFGEVLSQPVFGEETIGIAELDRCLIARAKFDLDVVGHYARPDVFRLTVNSGELTSVEFQPILNGNSLKEAAP